MRDEKIQAFVLSTLDYGDSDRIVSLFSLEHGRIKAFARAARKSRKRFGAALETFARIDAIVRLKEGLSSINQADIISIYPSIRGDLQRIAHAIYACELIDSITPEGHPIPRLYRLVSAYLDRLEKEPALSDDRRFFEINLLNILGYRPSIEHCTRCSTVFGDGGALLQQGGEMLCPSCSTLGRPVNYEVLQLLMRSLATGSFGRVKFSIQSALQAGNMLDEAVSAHTGQRLKSLEFLQQITE